MKMFGLQKVSARHLRLSGAVASLVLGAVPVLAEGNAGAGAALYAQHCVSCHGPEADGRGPMREVLLVQPSDLTTLTARHGGAFPVERVAQRIDGRDPLVAHGSSMPVYGDFFDTTGQVAVRTGAGQPVMVSQPVADLIVFLESLQAE
ncbi:c-type cytochrome [Roseovarius atlanticus]|uniref:c-type cytochrome n=1 Tax=Roseovarius atlanticus TaxID=1641875 RepID=UPI0021BD62F8|nr:c-type cytochrome [Roseovarius atlanticus]